MNYYHFFNYGSQYRNGENCNSAWYGKNFQNISSWIIESPADCQRSLKHSRIHPFSSIRIGPVSSDFETVTDTKTVKNN